MRIIKRLLIFMILTVTAVVLLLADTFLIEPHLLVTKNYEIKSSESAQTKLKVIQLSDLELSADYPVGELDALVRRVNRKKPDIILFTGDLYENYAQYHRDEEVIEHLQGLQAVYGKFAIWGNNDYGGGAGHHYQEIMGQSGFELLTNTGVNLNLADGTGVFLGGVDDGLLGNADVEAAFAANSGDNQYRILMIHEPELITALTPGQADLVLAGHTHGGQLGLKILRQYMDVDQRWNAGWYRLENLPDTRLYVHSGMGTSRIHGRFLMPPQFTYFEISI